jgi:MSHA pilin protein MshD
MTLVECLVATTILSATLLAVSYTVVAGNQNAIAADRASRAARVARDILEEVSSKAYQDPDQTPVFGPEPGEIARAQYDDVDDYNGYAVTAGQLVDATGSLYLAEDQVFSVSVAVTAGQQNIAELGGTIDGLLVTVAVRHTSGEQWSFTRYIPKP